MGLRAVVQAALNPLYRPQEVLERWASAGLRLDSLLFLFDLFVLFFFEIV
jgi:hypothetical protein